jgi:hypothetical protein
VASTGILAGIVTRYVRDNVLNTERYVQIVGPLSKDPAVATALADFTTEKVFSSTQAEQRIKDFLPPKLGGLASPLTNILQKKVNETTLQFVESDNFNSMWIAANRGTSKAVLQVAEGKEGNSKLKALGSLDLGKLLTTVREKLNLDSTILTDETIDKAAAVQVNLHQSVAQLRTAVSITKGSAHVLPYISIALLLAAIAVAYKRRHTIIGISITYAVLSAVIIIAFKVTSGSLLGQMSSDVNRAAAEVIYNAFYSDLHRRLASLLVASILLLVVAILAGPYPWAVYLRKLSRLDVLRHTTPFSWARQVRKYAALYELWLLGAGAVVTLITLLVLSTVTIGTVAVVVSLYVSFAALLHIVGHPAPSKEP